MDINKKIKHQITTVCGYYDITQKRLPKIQQKALRKGQHFTCSGRIKNQ